MKRIMGVVIARMNAMGLGSVMYEWRAVIDANIASVLY